MAGTDYIQKAYLYIGGIFSTFYFIVGLFICTGRLSFGMEPSVSFLIGAVLMAYGVFRAFVFFKKYKAYKRQENQNGR